MTVHELSTWRASRGKRLGDCRADEDFTEAPDPIEAHDVDLLFSAQSPHPVGWVCSCGEEGTI